MITTLDNFEVAIATNPADYKADILEGLVELNHIEPTGFTALEICEKILASSNRVNFPRVFMPCHDRTHDMHCAGWIVATVILDFMEQRRASIGPVWVRKGYHGEPLLAIRPHVAKWAASVGCIGFTTDSIRYDKQNKTSATIRAYSKWAEQFGLHETAVKFEGPL